MARRWEVGCLAICVIPNTVNQGSRLPLNRQEAVSHRHFTVGTVLPMWLLAEVSGEMGRNTGFPVFHRIWQ
jgi:hypothetical protein